VGATALALLLALPMGKLVSLAAIPDAFTLIPLYRLQVHAPHVDLQLVVDLLAAAAVVAFAFVPRRVRFVLPLALGLVLAAVSLSAGRAVAGQASIVRVATVGKDRRWIDDTARGDVAYLHSGEVSWISAWSNVFWNNRITRVYDLLTAQVPGPIPQPSVGPFEDGRLVLVSLRNAPAQYVVASQALRFFGTVVRRDREAQLALWRLDQPFRLREWVQELRVGRRLERLKVLEYACAGGELRLRVTSPVAQRVVVKRNERVLLTLRMAPGYTWTGRIPAAPPRPIGKRLCTFAIEPAAAQMEIRGLGFVRRPF
jgi:hypothetical protein